MSTVVLDTHVLVWHLSDPDRLSRRAIQAIERADELAVASMSWYELAWLAQNGRITVSLPVRTWIADIARSLVTIDITPAIASTAVALPPTFPNDPADRLIYASAIESGYQLVTKDRRLRDHPHPRPITVW